VTALNYADSSYRMTQHVYFRDATGALAETTGSGTTWSTATIGGQLGASSPIVAVLTDAGGTLTPHVFGVSADGQLIEAVRTDSTWSIRTLPGEPSPTTSLSATVAVRRGAVEVHLFYVDRDGQLQENAYVDGRWRQTPVTVSRQPAPGSSLAATAFGPDGGVVHVFYLVGTGALVDAMSRGGAWSARVLPGAPALSSRLLAQAYLPTAVTASSSRLSISVFYLTASGDPAASSYAPTISTSPRWTATTLGGTGEALLAASAYPDGVQGQQLFYRFGAAVYDNAYSPVHGSWYPARMPGSAAP
jgi:Fungal fucose-specific lectin